MGWKHGPGIDRRRVLTLVTSASAAVMVALGYWQKHPCDAAGWPYSERLLFGRRCYSDLPFLFQGRGLAHGVFPYAPGAGARPLEYPVLTGYALDAVARLTRLLVPDPDSAVFSRSYRD